MKTEIVKLSQIKKNPANPRQMKDDRFVRLVNSVLVLPKMLELRPIVTDDALVALGGNMRYLALSFIAKLPIAELKNRLAGLRDFDKKPASEQAALVEYWKRWHDAPTAPIIKASELTDDERREFIIKDNVGFGEWDYDMSANDWDAKDLDDWGVDVWQDGPTDGGSPGDGGASDNTDNLATPSLNDRFVVPPFSILDSRKGYWQERKKQWYALIGDKGETRSDALVTSPEMKYHDLYRLSRQRRKELGISFKEYIDKYVSKEELEKEQTKIVAQGVSIFDPVLAEIACRWFTPDKSAKIFDPFAGDTCKGLVFGYCGHEFTGVELRQEQIDVNNRVIEKHELAASVRYICDDGQNVANHFDPESQDFLFSCPPYYDLEIYSDLPNDASNQGTYEEFIGILRNAFIGAISRLKNDRFAFIVVGDVRDKRTGGYYDFVGDVKKIFKDGGMVFYNDIVLIEIGATAGLRAALCMGSRKVVKTHQNVLVFYKGDPKSIKKNFPKIEYASEDLDLFTQESGEDLA